MDTTKLIDGIAKLGAVGILGFLLWDNNRITKEDQRIQRDLVIPIQRAGVESDKKIGQAMERQAEALEELARTYTGN